MRQSEHKITLHEVLAALPDNSLDWRMLWLHASGTDWLGRASIVDLEEEVRGEPMGIPVAWPALKSFAAGLTDLHDVLLAAAPLNLALEASEIRAEDYRSAYIVIEGFDDGQWTIGSSDDGVLGGLPKSWNIRDVHS